MTLVSFLKMLDQISLIQGCLRYLKKRNAKITTCNEKTQIEILKKKSKSTKRKRKLYRKIVSQKRQK